MGKDIIEELNQFLEGNLMAIHAYENYIHHVKDPNVKKKMQDIQKNHKEHAMTIAERIQNLGGKPVNDVGMKDTFMEFMMKMKNATDGTIDILKDALAGEERGIEKSQEMLEGDLDPESEKIVATILNRDKKHVDILHEMIEEQN